MCDFLYHFVFDDKMLVVLNEQETVALWIDHHKYERYASLSNNLQSLCGWISCELIFFVAFATLSNRIFIYSHFILEIHCEIGNWTMVLWCYWFLQNTSILMVIDEWIHSIAHCFIKRKSKLLKWGSHQIQSIAWMTHKMTYRLNESIVFNLEISQIHV